MSEANTDKLERSANEFAVFHRDLSHRWEQLMPRMVTFIPTFGSAWTPLWDN